MASVRGFASLTVAIWAFGGLGAAGAQRGPVVEYIEPTSGPPGTTLHIVGRRFGRGATASIGATPLKVERSLPNRITVRVVAGSATGTVKVTTSTGSAAGPAFRVTAPLPAPVINEVSPASGPPGSHVMIKGKHFSPRLTRNAVTLGAAPVVVLAATPEALTVVVPQGDKGGKFTVKVVNAGLATSDQPFEVTAGTAITAVSPLRGPPGTKLKISGSGFAAERGDNRVYINNVKLKVEEASTTELSVLLPKKVSTGKLLVDVKDAGRAHSAQAFVVQRRPTVLGFSPAKGAAGTLITVRGTNFGKNKGVVEASMGDAKLVVREVARTRLGLELPDGAKSDKISVRVNDVGPAWSKKSFVVTSALRISGFSPRSGPAGTIVTVNGKGFDAKPMRNRVTISGKRAEVVSVTGEELTFRVPPTSSGPIMIKVAGTAGARTTDPFVVTVPPRVKSVAPKQSTVGGDITIRGASFGTNAAVVKVTLGEHPLSVRSVRDDVLVARVTPGAKSGRLKVAIPLQGAHLVDELFEVLPNLVIAALEPEGGRVGSTVTVIGSGFLGSGTLVEFGGASATPDTVGRGKLSVKVPTGARSGLVTVRLPDGRSAPSPRVFAVE